MIKNKLLLICITLLFVSCSHRLEIIDNQLVSNTREMQEKPYVVMISLDGFRWDYVQRFQPPNLLKFINEGVQAESLIPSFPSKTFPNHYTIATGLYPDRHGIIGNRFYSYEKENMYSISDRNTVEDGDYYKGTPIWSLASQNGMMSSSYFFIGSEAVVDGLRPSYYYNYDGQVTKETQVNQVLQWVKLPVKTRPHMITLYFSDMDDAAHDWSPDNNPKLKEAMTEVDEALGQLFDGLEKTGLDVNVIIVSDHGMMTVPVENYIKLESVFNQDLYYAVDNGSLINIHPKIDDHEKVWSYLKDIEKGKPFKVFRTDQAPGFETELDNPDWGEFQIIADKGFYFSRDRHIKRKRESENTLYGAHGFDVDIKDMQGIFYANGPAFKNGHLIPSIKNIHIYPLICEILGLKPPTGIDGDLKQIESVLKGR